MGQVLLSIYSRREGVSSPVPEAEASWWLCKSTFRLYERLSQGGNFAWLEWNCRTIWHVFMNALISLHLQFLFLIWSDAWILLVFYILYPVLVVSAFMFFPFSFLYVFWIADSLTVNNFKLLVYSACYYDSFIYT